MKYNIGELSVHFEQGGTLTSDQHGFLRWKLGSTKWYKLLGAHIRHRRHKGL